MSLGEAFTLFLYFYAVFTPISILLLVSKIKRLERQIEDLTIELIKTKRKMEGKND